MSEENEPNYPIQNKIIMKPNPIIKEILLVTTTSFSQRQLCEIDVTERNNYLTPAEQLEVACWNGLVDELLPEIMQKSSDGEKLFLWSVEMRKSYLRLSLGACSPILEKCFTIDPHIFLTQQEMS